MVGDAANEPSLCIDPLRPARMAVGWRQFDRISSDFRQAGYGYTTNGGLNWTYGGVLETNVFRSDPVLAADAEGNFYYLSLMPTPDFHCDLWRSSDGGRSWTRLGDAYGGDKAWMTIDTTPGPGRGNIYQFWSPFYPASITPFSFSTDSGLSWQALQTVPELPYWGTCDVGPNGELYLVGRGSTGLVFVRSRNAAMASDALEFEPAVPLDLGGDLSLGTGAVNPAGLLGQLWVAADRSSGPTRGHIYVLASVTTPGGGTDVRFSRSTDNGMSWSPSQRISDDPQNTGSWHWFGTLSVAPNGRIDACWYDTRNSPDASQSELYYTFSMDGGSTWAPNRPLSPPFNHRLGYPIQQKIGDYIGMVSLEEGACIAYSATFNGEQDVWFVRAELPILATIAQGSGVAKISWNSTPGTSYCVQFMESLRLEWSAAQQLGCVMATGNQTTLEDHGQGGAPRFYRVVRML